MGIVMETLSCVYVGLIAGITVGILWVLFKTGHSNKFPKVK